MASLGGRIFDLTHRLYHNMPVYPTVMNLEINVTHQIVKDGYVARELRIFTHHGTHMDAPAHMINGGRTLDDFDPSVFIQPAVILNLTTFVKPGAEITPQVLSRFSDVIRRYGAILLYTGWSGKRGWNEDYLYKWPYLDVDGARYLAEFSNVRIVGIDGLSIAGYGRKTAVETHRILLERGILIIEELNFENIASELRGRDYVDGTLIALPLLIENADGAPARVLFILGKAL